MLTGARLGTGWQHVRRQDEEAIRAEWVSRFQPGAELIVSPPAWTWQGEALAEHSHAVEAEFAEKLFAAFRLCTRPGERLWVIDWQHDWYYLDPHSATGERPVPTLPDGDATNYVTPDFRFGLVMSWSEAGPVTLFGADLIAEFADNPPQEFMRLCGQGARSSREYRVIG